jgi:hypothetical protein
LQHGEFALVGPLWPVTGQPVSGADSIERGMMGMVEKARAFWYTWIPGWLPIVCALIYIGMQYQRNNDHLDASDKQIIELTQEMHVMEEQINRLQAYIQHRPHAEYNANQKNDETATW